MRTTGATAAVGLSVCMIQLSVSCCSISAGDWWYSWCARAMESQFVSAATKQRETNHTCGKGGGGWMSVQTAVEKQGNEREEKDGKGWKRRERERERKRCVEGQKKKLCTNESEKPRVEIVDHGVGRRKTKTSYCMIRYHPCGTIVCREVCLAAGGGGGGLCSTFPRVVLRLLCGGVGVCAGAYVVRRALCFWCATLLLCTIHC